MENLKETENWIQEKTLGSGGFGFVFLWKNKSTDERIAIKQCRLGVHDMVKNEKCHERWKLEVSIMQKLSHPNVIKAIPVPEELEDGNSLLPMLAMEFCSHGDLRQVLKNPLNSCGLPEFQVRNIIENVASAVQYLHSKKIIHRDLKPENIVSQEIDGKVIYKLIDLGYAKEFEQNSLCSSFVGTVQYLAPELFLSEQYNSTVDYWSLGLVAHECITGVRPFLPNMTPAQWMPLVCKKKSSNICVYQTNDGKIQYSDELFRENHLNKLLVRDMENWLRVMLEWRPEMRGTKNQKSKKEIIAFTSLDEILSKKIAHVFHVGDGSLHWFEINENMSMGHLLSSIAQEIKIPEGDLEFLLPRGLPPDKKQDSLKCWIQPDEDEWMLFVYPKNPDAYGKIEETTVALVSEMVAQPSRKMKFQEQHKTWCHALYFLQKEGLRMKHFLQAQRILMWYLSYCNSHMTKSVKEAVCEMKQLQAVWDFFQASLNFDKQSYDEQAGNGLTSERLQSLFKSDLSMSKKIADLQLSVKDIESKADLVNTKTVELQRNHMTKGQKSNCIDDIIQEGGSLLKTLREKSRAEKEKESDNHAMIKLIMACLKSKSAFQKQNLDHLNNINKAKEEALQTISSLESVKKSLAQHKANLYELQKCRQQLMWKSLTCIVKRLDEQGQPPGNNSLGSNGAHNSLAWSSLASSGQFSSLSSILNKNSEESQKIIQENQRLLSRLEETSLSPSEPLLEFDFLKEDQK